MIKIETINERLKKTYSDSNKMIRKVGTQEIYTEAVDLITSTFQYEETNIEIAQEAEL